MNPRRGSGLSSSVELDAMDCEGACLSPVLPGVAGGGYYDIGKVSSAKSPNGSLYMIGILINAIKRPTTRTLDPPRVGCRHIAVVAPRSSILVEQSS
jgi:hypothetical protein